MHFAEYHCLYFRDEEICVGPFPTLGGIGCAGAAGESWGDWVQVPGARIAKGAEFC